MADSAVVLQWGQPFAGREEMSLGVFMAAIEYYTKLKASKDIENFSIYINQGGNLSQQQGSMIVEGTPDQIMALVQREDYKTLVTKAAHVVPDLMVTMADTGNMVMQRIEKLQMARKELGITK